jgi:hypothetical protein
MALTKSFSDLVQRRVASYASLGEALLREEIDTILAGDVDTGKAILRDCKRERNQLVRIANLQGGWPPSLA